MAPFIRWHDDFRRWGLLRFLHIRLMRAVSAWLTLCAVVVRRLNPAPVVPAPPCGIDVRLATAEDLERACRQPELKLSRDWVRAAQDRGDMCVASFAGERMVAYMWRSFSAAPHLHGLWVHFEKPYRYGYNAFTLPEFRGRHLSEAMGPILDPHSLAHGFTHAISFIESHNYSSLASDMRRGSVCVGWVGYARLFGRVWPFRSPGARHHRFGFFPRPKRLADGAIPPP